VQWNQADSREPDSRESNELKFNSTVVKLQRLHTSLQGNKLGMIFPARAVLRNCSRAARWLTPEKGNARSTQARKITGNVHEHEFHK